MGVYAMHIGGFVTGRLTNKLRHEKTCFLHMENKGADQLRGDHAADQCLCFRFIDIT